MKITNLTLHIKSKEDLHINYHRKVSCYKLSIDKNV